MDGSDSQLRRMLAETLTHIGGLAEHAAELGSEFLGDPPPDPALTGPAEDVASVTRMLDRLAAQIVAQRNELLRVKVQLGQSRSEKGNDEELRGQLQAMTSERDRLAAALERSRRETDEALREAEAKVSHQTLRATELSRQLGELTRAHTERLSRQDAKPDPDRRTTPSTAHIEGLLAAERAARAKERHALHALLAEAREALLRHR